MPIDSVGTPDQRRSVLSDLQTAGLREVNPDLLSLYLEQYIKDQEAQGVTPSPDLLKIQNLLQSLPQAGRKTSPGNADIDAALKSAEEITGRLFPTNATSPGTPTAPTPSGPSTSPKAFDPNEFGLGGEAGPTGPTIGPGTLLDNLASTLPLLSSGFGLARSAERGDPASIGKAAFGLGKDIAGEIFPQVKQFTSPEGLLSLLTGAGNEITVPASEVVGGVAPTFLEALGPTLSTLGSAAPVLGPVIGALSNAFFGPNLQQENTANKISGLLQTEPANLERTLTGARQQVDPTAPTESLLNQYNTLLSGLASAEQLGNATLQSNKRENSLTFPDFSSLEPTREQSGRDILRSLAKEQDVLQRRGADSPRSDSPYRFAFGDLAYVPGLPSQIQNQVGNPDVQFQQPPVPNARFLDAPTAVNLLAQFGGVDINRFTEPNKPEGFLGARSVGLEGDTLSQLVDRVRKDPSALGIGGAEFSIPAFRPDFLADASRVPTGGLSDFLSGIGALGDTSTSPTSGTGNVPGLPSGGITGMRSSGSSNPEKDVLGAAISSSSKPLLPQTSSATLKPVSTLDDLISQAQQFASGGA